MLCKRGAHASHGSRIDANSIRDRAVRERLIFLGIAVEQDACSPANRDCHVGTGHNSPTDLTLFRGQRDEMSLAHVHTLRFMSTFIQPTTRHQHADRPEARRQACMHFAPGVDK